MTGTVSRRVVINEKSSDLLYSWQNDSAVGRVSGKILKELCPDVDVERQATAYLSVVDC